jgi:small GTP-binding protein
MAPDFRFKLILMGDAGVGKSSIVDRRCYDDFSERHPGTIGIESCTTVVKLSGVTIEFRIWDTAGQEQYSSLIPMFTRNTDVCILVADANNRQSVDSLPKWESILQETGDRAPIIVAINKIDLIQDKNHLKTIVFGTTDVKYENVIFVSAKTGSQIDLLFRMAAEQALAAFEKNRLTGDRATRMAQEVRTTEVCC